MHWGVAACAVLLVGAADGSPKDTSFSIVAPLAEQSLLLDAVETDGRIVAVGERGHVLLSSDGGQSWIQVRVPSSSTLTAVTAIGRNVWTVGHDAVILHSADSGSTWERQYSSTGEEGPLLDVWFADADRGLAVGAYGLSLITDDGGAGWKRIEIDPKERHLNAIAAGDSDDVYIAGEFGIVFHSGDRGSSWTLASTPYDGSLFGALALDNRAVLVFGLRGHVFRSDDAGQTWGQVDSGTDATLLGGVELRGGSLLLVGHSGTLLVSHDEGHHFLSLNRPDRHALSAALPGRDGEVLLFGEAGVHATTRETLGTALQ
jgi:photosystem II stability/assembly factor-like uncharacterized protein